MAPGNNWTLTRLFLDYETKKVHEEWKLQGENTERASVVESIKKTLKKDTKNAMKKNTKKVTQSIKKTSIKKPSKKA